MDDGPRRAAMFSGLANDGLGLFPYSLYQGGKGTSKCFSRFSNQDY
jgi:hypothetical protein